MRWTTQAGCGDRHHAHHGGPDRRGCSAAGERIDSDEAQCGPGRITPQDGAQGALNDARENRDLEAAEDEQMDESGGDERLLKLRWYPVADTKHDSQQHSGVGRGQRRVEGGCVASAEPCRQRRKSGRRVGHIDAGRIQL